MTRVGPTFNPLHPPALPFPSQATHCGCCFQWHVVRSSESRIKSYFFPKCKSSHTKVSNANFSGQTVMCESQVERIPGADHPASSYCQLALCASNSLLGKSHLTSCYASNNPENYKRGLPVKEMLSKETFYEELPWVRRARGRPQPSKPAT